MLDALSFACPDWEEKLKRGETPIADVPLNAVYAEVAVDLFNKLRIPDVAGQPTMGEAAGEWVRDIVRAAFGCVSLVDDPKRPGKKKLVRHVGEVFNLVPKKNAKTTNAGAIGLVWLQLNRTPNANGVVIGPTQEVADTCFGQMSQMIELDDYLRKRFRVIEHRKTIIDMEIDQDTGRPRNAKLRVKSFDPKVVTGGIPAFAILDELHVMAESHYASRVIGQIRGGMITSTESLLVIITTQSENRPSGVFKVELDYARGVRDGKITQSVRMLPVIYEFSERVQLSADRKWQDPAIWHQVMPNLGLSLHLDRMIDEFQQAKDKGLSNLTEWASQHLNIQPGMGTHDDRWAGADFWAHAAQPGLTLDEIIATSDVCTFGGDGGGLDDLMSMGVIGRHRETRVWRFWARAWADPIVFERRKQIAETLRGFEKDGDLVVGDLNTAELEIVAICARLHAAGLLPEKDGIGLDPFGIASLLDHLGLAGLGETITGIGQGYKLGPAIQTLPRMLKDRKLIHCDQPLVAWSVGNVKTVIRGNNTLIEKKEAGVTKIDPVIAMLNAAMLMLRDPEASGASEGSYLDDTEMLVF